MSTDDKNKEDNNKEDKCNDDKSNEDKEPRTKDEDKPKEDKPKEDAKFKEANSKEDKSKEAKSSGRDAAQPKGAEPAEKSTDPAAPATDPAAPASRGNTDNAEPDGGEEATGDPLPTKKTKNSEAKKAGGKEDSGKKEKEPIRWEPQRSAFSVFKGIPVSPNSKTDGFGEPKGGVKPDDEPPAEEMKPIMVRAVCVPDHTDSPNESGKKRRGWKLAETPEMPKKARTEKQEWIKRSNLAERKCAAEVLGRENIKMLSDQLLSATTPKQMFARVKEYISDTEFTKDADSANGWVKFQIVPEKADEFMEMMEEVFGKKMERKTLQLPAFNITPPQRQIIRHGFVPQDTGCPSNKWERAWKGLIPFVYSKPPKN